MDSYKLLVTLVSEGRFDTGRSASMLVIAFDGEHTADKAHTNIRLALGHGQTVVKLY